ncbi:MAG: cupin domain-containing protein [Deltaproteobacteria bacterium]|nr:cupin domain-containing protein [Deltaproteobacteria bacterium]
MMFQIVVAFTLPCMVYAAPAPASSSVSAQIRNVINGRETASSAILAGKGTAKVLLTVATGAKEAALSVLVLEDGAQIPEHVHVASAELLYIEDGAIEMVIDGKALKAVKGDAVYIPKGVAHSARPTSGVGAVRAVQVYVGPGPEQRYLTGGKPAK